MKGKFIGVTIKGSHAKMSVDLTHGLVSFMVEGDEGSQSIFVYDAREIAELYRAIGQWLEEQEAANERAY